LALIVDPAIVTLPDIRKGDRLGAAMNIWKAVAVSAVSCAFLIGPAFAAKRVNIVALGPSNTYGHGIGKHSGGVSSRTEAYPAQLEAMLRAKGYDAHVTNAGIPGDTTAGMLARLDRDTPAGTQIVIIMPGGNDVRKGGTKAEAQQNVARMKQILAHRGIRVIVLDHVGRGVPPSARSPDGMHFNAHGYHVIAARVLPQVIADIRKN
jgi:acyl-CoA thioesterase-1